MGKNRHTLQINGQNVDITHPNKQIWPEKNLAKIDFLHYLSHVSDQLLPFLKNRHLTVIRYPDGTTGEAFFQKNCPDYAPDYVLTHASEGIDYIVCNDKATLFWLGNQSALEYHIPFKTVDSDYPSEIVFDLDPPSRDEFHLAIKAAQLIKGITDKLKLITYVKTSGNKGLQVMLPLPDKTFSFDDTRLFTSFIAKYLVGQQPDLFTIERLKKHRGNRLYVDYIQHAEGKTIVAPYSARGNSQALVATPLFWDEVTDALNPEQFSIVNVPDRIKQKGCPLASFFNTKSDQPFEPVLRWLKDISHTDKKQGQTK